jgi:RecA/RadA recombinase
MKGRGQIKEAINVDTPFLYKRLPTGIITIDTALRGGWPCGGISQIAGPKNSCKSYLYWQTIRQLQYNFGSEATVLLAMTEMRADRSQARNSGVIIAYSNEEIATEQKRRASEGIALLTEAEIDSMQNEIGVIDEMHCESAEAMFDGILKAIEAKAYMLIVIDSLGSLMTKAEAESDTLEQKFYGGSAKIITEFLRKLNAYFSIDDGDGFARDTCVLAVNQIRDVIGDPHKEFRSPGGRGLEHALFVNFFTNSGASIGYDDQVYTQSGTKKRYIQTGKEINWKIEKGKAGMHEGAKGSFNYDFRNNQADFFVDTIVAGVRCNAIEVSGAWLGIHNPAAPGEYLVRACGKEAFTAALIADVTAKVAAGDENTFMNMVRKAVFAAEKIQVERTW